VRSVAVLILALAVSACASGGASKPPILTQRAPAVAQPAPGSFRGPPMPSTGQLGAIIGLQASALIERFGKARIDLSEGDARKLQFTGSTCVLDIFLYPASAGAEPVASHVESRLRRDGSATDRQNCIREVELQR